MSFIGDTNYLQQQLNMLAPTHGIDPQAAFAVAKVEGAGGGIGDGGTSFGPFQLHKGGALPDWVGQLGQDFANQWSWSTSGINYALQKMASSGASGKTGSDAVVAIVTNFERPSDPGSEIRKALDQLTIVTGIGQVTTTTGTTTTGDTQTGTTTGTQTPAPGDTNAGQPPASTTCTAPTGPNVINPLAWVQYWMCIIFYDIQRGIVMIVGIIIVILGIWIFGHDKDAPDVVKVPVKATETAGKKAGSSVKTAAEAATVAAAA
jgi:hypothetical protein